MTRTSNVNTLTEWITVKDAAARISVTTSTIRRWVREGRLRSILVASGRIRVDAQELTIPNKILIMADEIWESVR